MAENWAPYCPHNAEFAVYSCVCVFFFITYVVELYNFGGDSQINAKNHNLRLASFSSRNCKKLKTKGVLQSFFTLLASNKLNIVTVVKKREKSGLTSVLPVSPHNV